MKLHFLAVITLALAASTLMACTRAQEPAVTQANLAAVAVSSPRATLAATPDAEPIADAPISAHMVVHKSPSCGCCGLWVDHMREAGFAVEVRDIDNVHPIKERVGVPFGMGSCHTAEIGGYFIEGHVPAEDIKRLLPHKPDAKGLALPGMPAGSPGMEMPDGRTQAYTVELVRQDGTTETFAQHGQ